MTTNDNIPHDEPKMYWFEKLIQIGELPVFRQLRLLISLIFIRVAPEIPVSLRKSYSGQDGFRAGTIGFLTTFLFTFGVNIVATAINGTLVCDTIFAGRSLIAGGGPSVIYFLDDWWNLVLYVFVCPAYVGLTCWLSVVVIKGYGEIEYFKRKELSDGHISKKFNFFKSIALVVLILAVAFTLTANYISDIMELSKNEKYYWFLTETNGEGYQIRALGVYYFLLNFSLLIVTLVALTLFMSIYSVIMGVGRALESRMDIGDLKFESLKGRLYMFTEAYIVTKGIIACYVVNIWVWADRPWEKE